MKPNDKKTPFPFPLFLSGAYDKINISDRISLHLQMRQEAFMEFRCSVGNSDFADLRKDNAYYVDKTEILYELVKNTNNMVTLFTRPRRFGKTLVMSMMENFLQHQEGQQSHF